MLEKKNNLSKYRYKSQIYQIPEILIIILKRDKNSFINVELGFRDRIDIIDFASKKDIPHKLIYDLYGIVSYEQILDMNLFAKIILIIKGINMNLKFILYQIFKNKLLKIKFHIYCFI